MGLNRTLQKELLDRLKECYPNDLDARNLSADEVFNLAYLVEHGLCWARPAPPTLNNQVSFLGARITARGLDFLQDDGGLTAVLGTVTVKLHADTIKDLLKTEIEKSTLPNNEKSALRQQIESLPETALQTASTTLIQTGILHMPNIVQWITNLFS
jgi:hypothetical protein